MSLITELKALLGPEGWREGGDLSPYLTEQRGLFQGQAAFLARPADAAAVAEVVRRCAEAGAPIVPYGGGTGLVGGQVRPEGPPGIILSTERLRVVRRVSPGENALVIEAGATVVEAQAAAEAVDRLFPLSLASEGSCTVGGVLATNAGGMQAVRYGVARDLCLGLEVVTPAGEIWSGLTTVRKDNTGFDLRHLYIGSEGALGVITAAALKLYAQPRARLCAFIGLADPKAAIVLLRRLQALSDEAVAVFELMPRLALSFSLDYLPGSRDPLAEPAPWYVLTELWGADAEALQGALEEGLAEALEDGSALDAAIAQNNAQAAAFRLLREGLSDAQKPQGASIKHDISAPIDAIPEFLAKAAGVVEAISPGARPCPFGHLGDGNLHYNISQPLGAAPDAFMANQRRMNRALHDLVVSMGGSISAEHGVGRLKREELARHADPAKMGALYAIKAALDPKGIMNPGVILQTAE